VATRLINAWALWGESLTQGS